MRRRRWVGYPGAACVTDHAARKPATAAAPLIAGGLVRKLKDNPLELPGDGMSPGGTAV